MAWSVKRCPFCGGEAKVWTRTSFDRVAQRDMERTTVLCRECGCRTQAFLKPREAVRAWNSRAAAGMGRPAPWWRRLIGG